MTSSYPMIRHAYRKRKEAEDRATQDFHLDSRIWKLVVKELSPASSYWLSEDLTSKGKLLYRNCLLSVGSDGVHRYEVWASFIDIWAERNNMKTDTTNAWLNKTALEVPRKYFEKYAPSTSVAEEIEFAIVKVLWREGAWPESLHYNGRAVSTYFVSHDSTLSTDCDKFGFVYFIRNRDLYKVGITTDMLRRMAELKPDEVLNMVRCSNYFDVESAIHKKFRSERIPQSEYFRLGAMQVQEVHEMMLALAVV